MHLSYPMLCPVRYILHPDPAAFSYCPMGQKLIQSNGVERSTLTASTILGHVGCAAKAGQPLGKEPFGISCILLALWLHWHRHQVRAGDAKREPSTAPRAPLGLAAGMGSLAGSSLWAGEEDASQGLELPQGIHLLHTLHGSEDHSSATVAKAGVHSTWRTYTVLERSWCECPSCWAGRQSIAVHQPPSLSSHPRLVGPCSTQPDWS